MSIIDLGSIVRGGVAASGYFFNAAPNATIEIPTGALVQNSYGNFAPSVPVSVQARLRRYNAERNEIATTGSGAMSQCVEVMGRLMSSTTTVPIKVGAEYRCTLDGNAGYIVIDRFVTNPVGLDAEVGIRVWGKFRYPGNTNQVQP